MPEELVDNSSALSIPFILVSLHWRAQVSRANPLGLAFVTHCPLSSAVTEQDTLADNLSLQTAEQRQFVKQKESFSFPEEGINMGQNPDMSDANRPPSL